MPRPNLSAKGAGASNASKSGNPFTNWLAKRKQRQMEAAEEAARMITNSIAKNQNTIIDQLSSIDFLHSKLPKSVLESKTNPNQKYCDLEYATQAIIHTLMRDPQVIKMDIRKFDEKLLTLVLLFKQAVEQGDVRAAYAAKGAVVRAVADIRSRIPQNQPELAKQFVESNAYYLEQWITLVGLAQVADRTKQNMETQRERFRAAEQNDKEKNYVLKSQIMEDASFSVAFNELMSHDLTNDRTQWTKEQREVHRMMVERRMGKVNLELNAILLQQQELDLSAKEAQVEVLFSNVASLPIVTDPNLMNKFQESVDNLFKQLAKTDAEIDEAIKTMDDIEGRLQQLNNAPGALRAQEVAAEEAEKALAELKRLEEDQSGKVAERARKMREEMGLHTEEQLAEMKKQAELEQQRAIEQLREQLQERETESELLVN